MPRSALARRLRDAAADITERYEATVVADLDRLAELPRAAVVDHLPEFLVALADWIEGDEEGAKRGFEALADGHALTRLGHGVPLEMLIHEYILLRRIILGALLDVGGDDVRLDLIRLNHGLDVAMYEAVNRYARGRDLVRERFIGILGHDLRTPLNAIHIASNQLLGDEKLAPRPVHLAAAIRRASDRMTRMISDLMDFARGHLGAGIPTTPEPCDMAEIWRTVLEELRIAHPDRELELRVGGDTTGAWDRQRVLQAASNLASNAIRHGQGVVRVEIAGDEHGVTTTISNAGLEIAPDLLRRLFDPFRAGDATSSRQGLGLGLFIVQQIALAHGATCEASSRGGRISFTVRWPRVPLNRVHRPS